jgi:uncharacterized protein (DUF924 family)
MTDEKAIEPADILAFWFEGDPTTSRKAWFVKTAEFDAACSTYAKVLRDAKAGRHDAWADTASGALALTIVLDQLSRNLHRGSAQAFEADSQARSVARAAIARGFDRALGPEERKFLYLPFEHSEDLADQEESVRLFETLRPEVSDDTTGYAHSHRDVIRRFGRFPHRNAALGRTSTAEEVQYLSEPGAGF